MNLFCALVGEAGNAFCVQVEEGDSVLTLKEAIKAKLANRLKAIDTDELQLYLAKNDDDSWLDSSSEDVKKLRKGGRTARIEALTHKDKEVDATAGLEMVLKAMPAPQTQQIHVLVVVPSDVVDAKRRRLTGAFHGSAARPPPTERLDSVPSPVVLYENYVSVSAALMDKCGLLAPHEDTVMVYCRPSVHALWKFVEDETIAENAYVYILGSPGTGKSLATLCYAAQLDRSEWHVVWIHLASPGNSCLSMGTGEFWKDIDPSTFVVPRVAGKRLLVCLDGYRATPTHEEFEIRTRRALTEDDRLLMCSSMATMGKLNDEDAELEKIRLFYLPSWTRAEYEAAVADAAFYEHIVSKLDKASSVLSDVNGDGVDDEEGGSEAEGKKKHALVRKFYYAGGSCRFMFQCTTDQVKQRLRRAVKSTPDENDLVYYCYATQNDVALNTLYGMAGERGGWFPVSSYVAALFAKETTKMKTIKLLASRLHSSSLYSPQNPAVDGPLLEWLLLASVPKEAIKLVGNGDVIDELPMAPVLQFDPTKRFRVSGGTIGGNKSWLQPVIWTPDGYDAVYFDQDQGSVIFVQLTRSHTHSIKMRVLYDVLLKLKLAGMAIETVDVYVVVKSDQNLESTTIYQVDDHRLLGEFDARWRSPEGNHVKVRAFEAVRLWWRALA